MNALPESPGMPGEAVYDRVGPSARVLLDLDALLGAELRDAAAQLRVPVGLDLRALGD
jgi:hypothetical protein